MNDLRVVFMGTPDFAVASLDKLIETGINVVAVITAPDKPRGRGKKIATSPVKDYALKKNIPLLQPLRLKEPSFLKLLKSYHADLQVVVAFRMLPEVVWGMPQYGTFNLHASLLPQYRGAAPINWAIINGEEETGVTTFFLQHEIDTGKIIFQEKETIREEDNAGSLYERLMILGAKLVLKTIQAIQAGNYPQEPQNENQELKVAPKIFKETCKIDWGRPSQEVHNFIRGLSPYPAAWTNHRNKGIKIFKTTLIEGKKDSPVGSFKIDENRMVQVVTADGLLSIDELQLEGKRRMTAKEFLRGNAELFQH